MKQKIYIGRINKESVFLTKHTWDCGWYWGFGYVGNRNMQFHIDSLINKRDHRGNYPSYDINNVFNDGSELTQDQWWIVRDLFIQAYALKEVAQVYRYGGHQTSLKGVTDIINNSQKAEEINKDLEIVLNTVWDYIINSIKENKEKELTS